MSRSIHVGSEGERFTRNHECFRCKASATVVADIIATLLAHRIVHYLELVRS